MMGDIINHLVVLRLMDEQESKTRCRVIIPCVSSGVSSLSIEPVAIDAWLYKLSGRVRYVSLLVWK